MLKQHHERDAVNKNAPGTSERTMTPVVNSPEPVIKEAAAGVLEEDEDDALELVLSEKRNAEYDVLGEIHASPDLTSAQKKDELRTLLRTYADIFSNKPAKRTQSNTR